MAHKLITMPFNFPEPLTERYRPKRLADFIGIARPLKVMKVFAARPYPSSWFFLGASGTGKTSLALSLTLEVGAELHHITSQKAGVEAIDEVCRMCYFVPMGGGMHLVLLDEADRMTPQAQLSLLSKLDAADPPPATIWIFTANSAQGLEDPFLSRCKILVFEQDSFEKELPRYLARVYKTESRRSLPLAKAEQLAKDSNFNVRDALNNLELMIMAGE